MGEIQTVAADCGTIDSIGIDHDILGTSELAIHEQKAVS